MKLEKFLHVCWFSFSLDYNNSYSRDYFLWPRFLGAFKRMISEATQMAFNQHFLKSGVYWV